MVTKLSVYLFRCQRISLTFCCIISLSHDLFVCTLLQIYYSLNNLVYLRVKVHVRFLFKIII